MTFEDARAYLDALGVDAMKSLAPSLHRMEALCDALDHPERRVPAIHVTGTNGKTSTARIITQLLSATGLSVGTYTSPHLESVRERLALNGEPLSEDAFGDAFDHVRRYIDVVEESLGERLTYFEVLTGMFFLWAAEAPVDALVVEVGLGGRWDATNVVPADIAVVTNVDFDHTSLMGNDRVTIAKEKAGIIKPGSIFVTAERTPEVLVALHEEAAGAGVGSSVLDKDFSIARNDVAVGGRYLAITTSERRYDELYLPLHGRHQGVNAAVGLEAVTRFLSKTLDEDLVNEGLGGVTAPGRLETIRPATDTSPAIVLDVAHNPAGMSALVSSVIEAFVFERVAVVVGVLTDKDYGGMLAELARLPCHLVVTEARSARSVPAEDLASAAREAGLEARVVPDVVAAVNAAQAASLPGELVLVTGSHYVVGEARRYLGG